MYRDFFNAGFGSLNTMNCNFGSYAAYDIYSTTNNPMIK